MKNKFNPLLGDEIQKITDHRLVFYDATVGNGGDYPNHAEAFAAGKRVVKQISDVVEVTSPAITGDYYIEGNNFSLTCDYQFSISSNLELHNLTLETSFIGNATNYFIFSGSLVIDRCKIIANADNIFYSNNTKFIANNCKFELHQTASLEPRLGVINSVFNSCNFSFDGYSRDYNMRVENTLFNNCSFSGMDIWDNGGSIIHNSVSTNNRLGNYGFKLIENSDGFKFWSNRSSKIPVIKNCNSITFYYSKQAFATITPNGVIQNSDIDMNYRYPFFFSKFVSLNCNLTFGLFLSNNKKFEQLEMIAGKIIGSALPATGYRMELVDKAIFDKVTFVEDVYFKDDNIIVNNCIFEGNVTIENTAANTIFTNNRVSGTFTDNGINTELNNNILTT